MQKLRAHKELRIGDVVRARARRWNVEDVQAFDRCTVVTLSGAGERNRGERRRMIVPFDRLDPLEARTRPRQVGRRRWQHVCRSALAAAAPESSLHTAADAAIDLLPHQLEPALALIRGSACRLLIADAVGLGKTIQAGLIISELQQRSWADRVLVLCPAGLREQWSAELESRFAIRASIVDASFVTTTRTELPLEVSPWALDPIVIASMDYIKRREVLPALLSERWDLIIVDEAHHAAGQSERREAVRALAARAAHVVLITATPHSGDSELFASLCRIGGQRDELLVFRRTRADVGLRRRRRVHLLHVRLNSDERTMHLRLAQFGRALLREHHASAVALGLSTLRKRALSSAFSLEQTVRRRLAGLDDRADRADGHQLPLPWDDAAIEGADAAPLWSLPMLADVDRERLLLERLADSAALAARRESKLLALARLLRRVREPAIVFTEYRDTLLRLHQLVAPGASIVHGGLSPEERRTAIARFVAADSTHAPPVLLATDAAGEGLNLHTSCRVVVNLELPWTPVRLEQRLGRVDRIGQRRTVHAFHFVAAGTDERRVLARLRGRVAHADADVGTDDPLSDGRDRTNAATAPRIASEALEECRRIAASRRLRSHIPSAPSQERRLDAPLVCHARGRLKRWLAGRSLAILRSEAVDGYGHEVAADLAAVLVDWQAPGSAADNVPHMLEQLVPLVRDNVTSNWESLTLARHQHYWGKRIERERHMLDAAAASSLHQPGLFDCRAQRRAAAQQEQLEANEVDGAYRLDRLARCAQLTVHPFRPILVALP